MASTPSQAPRFGSLHRGLSARGYRLAYWFVHRYGAAVEPHGHSESHFVFAASGDYMSEADDAPGWGGPRLVFSPPDTWHRDRFESPGAYFSITLSPQRWTDICDLRPPGSPCHVNGPGARVLIAELMRLTASGGDDGGLACEALCLELAGAAAGVAGRERRRPKWLDRGCDYMRERFADELTLSEIAAAAEVHPYHFARTFRTFEGRTPGGYLQALRLDRAAALLNRSDRPLAELALESGFADQSHLTRRFGADHGVAPGAFRRRLRCLS